MNPRLVALFALLASSFRTRPSLQTEVLAVRHQLAVLQVNAPRRLRLQRSDRLLWILLSRFWSGWWVVARKTMPGRVRPLRTLKALSSPGACPRAQWEKTEMACRRETRIFTARTRELP